MKRISKFNQIAYFLQNLIENVHFCRKLLTPHFDINDIFLIVFKPPENSNKVEKMVEQNMLSYGLSTVKMRCIYLFIYLFAYKLKSWIICYAYILDTIFFFFL